MIQAYLAVSIVLWAVAAASFAAAWAYAEAKNTNADVQISSREVTINLYVKALKDVIQSGGTRIHDE